MSTDTRPVTKDPETGRRTGIPLPAFEDRSLSVEAQERLIQLSNDSTYPTHQGKDLPSVAKEDLLANLK